MTSFRAQQGGYIALLMLLIVGAATTAIALVLLTTGTDAQRSALITQQSIQARQLANACAEEALQQIHDTTSYTGTSSLTLGAGNCSYTVTNTGTSTRTITTTATVGATTRKLAVYVTIGSSSISITSWQEVS
ncbi:MAG TPA: competence type IV pilus minor pilin ComGG [Candidatus Saccharimonadia bacterium]|nr:competence type IV pilus minor pilin ComGG [Candidatus Saccharimonadia bacterium]